MSISSISYDKDVAIYTLETETDVEKEIKLDCEKSDLENKFFNFDLQNLKIIYDDFIKNIKEIIGFNNQKLGDSVKDEDNVKMKILIKITDLKNENLKMKKLIIEQMTKLQKLKENFNLIQTENEKLKENIFELSVEFDDLKVKNINSMNELKIIKDKINDYEKQIKLERENFDKLSKNKENEIEILKLRLKDINLKNNLSTSSTKSKTSCTTFNKINSLFKQNSPISDFKKSISQPKFNNNVREKFYSFYKRSSVTFFKKSDSNSKSINLKSPRKSCLGSIFNLNSDSNKRSSITVNTRRKSIESIDVDQNLINFNLNLMKQLNDTENGNEEIKQYYENKIKSIESMYKIYIDKLESDLKRDKEELKKKDSINDNYDLTISNLKCKINESESILIKIENNLNEKIVKLQNELVLSINSNQDLKSINSILDLKLNEIHSKLEINLHENNSLKSLKHLVTIENDKLNMIVITLKEKLQEANKKIQNFIKKNFYCKCQRPLEEECIKEISNRKSNFNSRNSIFMSKNDNKFKRNTSTGYCFSSDNIKNSVKENKYYKGESMFLSNQIKILKTESEINSINYKREQELLNNELDFIKNENIHLRVSLANATFELESSKIKNLKIRRNTLY